MHTFPDLSVPDGVEALLAMHRATFGDARMQDAPLPAADGTGTSPPPAAPPAAPAPSAAATGDTPPATGQAPEPSKVEDLPEWAQRLIRDTRKEAGDQRTAKTAAEQKQQELLDGIAQALGVKKDDAPPDPAALQQTLSQREARIAAVEADSRAKDVELAAWRSASRQGANAVALLDSRSFLAEVGQLDPSANDFTAQLDAAVKKALEGNPVLRATPVPSPGQAGIGVTGGFTPPKFETGTEMVRYAMEQSSRS